MQSEVIVKKSYEETIAEVLSRWTIRDLVEQTDAALDIADKRYEKSIGQIKVVDTGEVDMIKFWVVESNGNTYDVRRFKNFVWCSCKAFFYCKDKQMPCKHLACTIAHYCKRCRAAKAREDGLCWGCHTDCFPYGKTATVNQETKNA